MTGTTDTVGVLGVLGAGGQAREVAGAVGRPVAFFAVSSEYLDDADPRQRPIERPTPEMIAVPVVAAVGAPGLRRRLVEEWPGDRFGVVTAAGCLISESARVGAGSMIAAGAILSTDVRIGRHVLVNIGATISHDSIVGDFATISPGVHVAGGVTIGDGVFIGIGAVVSHGVSIVAGAVIGAGAVVTADLDVAGVYVGVPARLVRRTDDWLQSL